jgi:hypothetical protein
MESDTREALTQLRRVAVQAPDELFHMNAVVEHAECGTARCLLGWMIIDPWFVTHTPIGQFISPNYFKMHLPDDLSGVAEIFGLSDRQANKLFGGGLDTNDGHAVPKAEVLWNIDRLLAGRKVRHYRATGKHKVVPKYALAVIDPPLGALDPDLLLSPIDPPEETAV